jgi:hypothetical protein
MSLKFAIAKMCLATLLCAAVFTALPRPASADGFTDAFVGYRGGTDYREPTDPDAIAKTILQFSYLHANQLGTSFFNLDILSSNGTDPANNGKTATPCSCTGGAQELYAVFRHEFSLSGLTQHKFAFGPVRDVGINAGFNYNSKQDNFTARVQQWMVGPEFSFKVPGHFDVSLMYRIEHNHSAFCLPDFATGCGVQFKPTFYVESSFATPLKLAIPAKFQGFVTYNTAKGLDGSGNPTAPEILLESALMWDVGSLAGKRNSVYLGVGYQFWRNKFGALPTVTGSQASPLQLEAEFHL